MTAASHVSEGDEARDVEQDARLNPPVHIQSAFQCIINDRMMMMGHATDSHVTNIQPGHANVTIKSHEYSAMVRRDDYRCLFTNQADR